MVNADDQHIVPWNGAGGRIQVFNVGNVFVAPPARLLAAFCSVALEPDLLQEVLQPGHEQWLTAMRGWDGGGVAGH